MNKLHSCNSLFCSCHLSARLSAHICPDRAHPYVWTPSAHAGTQTVSVKSSLELLSFYLFWAPAISLTDVIVRSGGGFSLIEVHVCLWLSVQNIAWLWLVLFGLSDKMSSALSLHLKLCVHVTITGMWDCEGHRRLQSNHLAVSQQQTQTFMSHLPSNMSYSQCPPVIIMFKAIFTNLKLSASLQLYGFYLDFFFHRANFSSTVLPLSAYSHLRCVHYLSRISPL